MIDIGGSAASPQSFAVCRVGANVAMIGLLTGHEGSLPTTLNMERQLHLNCIMVGSHKRDMLRAVEINNIHTVIDSEFSLDELADAFRYQESGKHLEKIVIPV